MSRIACKTFYGFPSGRFEGSFLKVITNMRPPRSFTTVMRVSLESMFDDQTIIPVAEKYASYEAALEGHDRWVDRAKKGDIPFKEDT